MQIFGYSAGTVLLVALAIIVGMKFYHDQHRIDPASTVGGAGASQPNGVNPASPGQGSMGYKL